MKNSKGCSCDSVKDMQLQKETMVVQGGIIKIVSCIECCTIVSNINPKSK